MTSNILNTNNGFKDLSFEESELFYRLSQKIYEIYRRYGAVPLRTSIVKPIEVLQTKFASEIEKQFTGNSLIPLTVNENQVALRYDQTEPTSAYILQNIRDIPFPLRVAASGMVFRREPMAAVDCGKKQQEFFQTDFDIIDHTEDISMYGDGEAICVLCDVLTHIMENIEGSPQIRFNNRKLVEGLILAMGMEGDEVFEKDLLTALDEYYKIGEQKFISNLQNLLQQYGKQEHIDLLVQLFTPQNTLAKIKEILQKFELENSKVTNYKIKTALQEIEYIDDITSEQGISAVFDPLIIRGLDIYTGTIFEGYMPGWEEYGAIAGGGRYDNLGSDIIRSLGLKNIPRLSGVGFSIGLDRITKIMQATEREKRHLVDVVIGPNVLKCISETGRQLMETLSYVLREQGKNVNVVPPRTTEFDVLSYLEFYNPRQFIDRDEAGIFIEEGGKKIYFENIQKIESVLLAMQKKRYD